MENLKNTTDSLNTEDFNSDPVYYCDKCLSLAIRIINDESCYCDKCGNTNVNTTDINNWQQLYEERYNKKFININTNGRK